MAEVVGDHSRDSKSTLEGQEGAAQAVAAAEAEANRHIGLMLFGPPKTIAKNLAVVALYEKLTEGYVEEDPNTSTTSRPRGSEQEAPLSPHDAQALLQAGIDAQAGAGIAASSVIKYKEIRGMKKNDCENGAGRELEKSVGKGDRHQKCADAVNAKGLKLFSVDDVGNCHGCKKFVSKSRDKGRKAYKVTGRR